MTCNRWMTVGFLINGPALLLNAYATWTRATSSRAVVWGAALAILGLILVVVGGWRALVMEKRELDNINLRARLVERENEALRSYQAAVRDMKEIIEARAAEIEIKLTSGGGGGN